MVGRARVDAVFMHVERALAACLSGALTLIVALRAFPRLSMPLARPAEAGRARMRLCQRLRWNEIRAGDMAT